MRLTAKTSFVTIAAALAIMALVVFYQISASTPPATPSNPIQHIVILMQENRSFDNFFWTWPGQVGYEPNLCMPVNPAKPAQGCIRPHLATSTTQPDMPHDWTSSWTSYDNGSMNGFLLADSQNTNAMSYYNNKTIPNIWSYASHYVLADQFFSSVKSYSQPNHWYMIAGQSPQVSLFEGNTQEQDDCYNKALGMLTLSGCQYINEAQQIQTMADELTTSGVSWKYYDAPIPANRTLAKAIQFGEAFDYWNPLLAKNSSYEFMQYRSNIVPREEFFSDIGNGTLPQVSWIIPSGGISDHPPANVTLGEWWITDVVNAVMQSRYWQNTAIIVAWDDYGGYFDTVVPPTVDGYGLSFRVPALIISAYSKPGYLDNTVYDFESTLRFIEWRFGVPSLTSRDADANNLLGAFNFNQQPLAPDIISLTPQQLKTIGPYILQGSRSTPNPAGASLPQPAFIGNDSD
jgi:phospholipase C